VRATPFEAGLCGIANNGQIVVAIDDVAEQSELCLARVLEFIGHYKPIRILDERAVRGVPLRRG